MFIFEKNNRGRKMERDLPFISFTPQILVTTRAGPAAARSLSPMWGAGTYILGLLAAFRMGVSRHGRDLNQALQSGL